MINFTNFYQYQKHKFQLTIYLKIIYLNTKFSDNGGYPRYLQMAKIFHTFIFWKLGNEKEFNLFLFNSLKQHQEYILCTKLKIKI